MEAAAKKPKVGNDLTQGAIYKTLIVFAVPIILTNLIQQLYSMVDLMVIGQFVGSVGTVGARNERRAKKTIGTLLGFMLGVSALLMLAAIVFSLPILHTLNCPGEALSQARTYMIITALGYPFVFGYNAVCGILRGMGESKRPLYFISVAALINIRRTARPLPPPCLRLALLSHRSAICGKTAKSSSLNSARNFSGRMPKFWKPSLCWVCRRWFARCWFASRCCGSTPTSTATV